MHFLKLCFALMVFGISAKAQEKETCFYYVSFYKWEWNCCYGKDTIAAYDLRSKAFSDSIVMDTASHPRYFIWELEHGKLFNHEQFAVTSMDGKINYEVKSIEFSTSPHDPFGGWSECPDAYLNQKALRALNTAQPGDHFWFRHLRIIDPKSRKEILLPGIEIYVE